MAGVRNERDKLFRWRWSWWLPRIGRWRFYGFKTCFVFRRDDFQSPLMLLIYNYPWLSHSNTCWRLVLRLLGDLSSFLFRDSFIECSDLCACALLLADPHTCMKFGYFGTSPKREPARGKHFQREYFAFVTKQVALKWGENGFTDCHWCFKYTIIPGLVIPKSADNLYWGFWWTNIPF